MQIVIDKEALVKMLKVSLYAVTGVDYEDVEKAVEELLDKVGYAELPEHHGALKDTDKFEKHITSAYEHKLNEIESHAFVEFMAALDAELTVIEGSTILEASEREDKE